MINREAFKSILLYSIEDYAGLLHLVWSIDSLLFKEDDAHLEIARKILSFYIKGDYIALFYDKLGDSEFVPKEIPKEKAIELILDDSSWDTDFTNVYITASATKKGEDLYNSGKIMDESFKLPKVLEDDN